MAGRRCLDVGASTGGFTQVLLEAGAAHVTALDVGHDQLVAEVADDARVEERSGVNIRNVRPGDLGRGFDLVVADLSFISLRLVLDVLAALMTPDADAVLLVKPQFEVGRERLARTGVVSSPHEHRRVLTEVLETARQAGLPPGLEPSPIRGTTEPGVPTLGQDTCRRAVRRERRSPPWSTEAPSDRSTVTRRILLVAHPTRPEVVDIARGVVKQLAHADVEVALAPDEAGCSAASTSGRSWRPTRSTRPRGASSSSSSAATAPSCAAPSSLAGLGVPLLGVNLGHVGFLAEAEREDSRRPWTASSAGTTRSRSG